MLEEYKKLYEDTASLISGWRRMSIPDLANHYLDCEESKKEAYLSAIICKYWKYINNYYYRQDIKTASIEDCYDWVIEGISQALSECAWRDKKSTIYNDPKGPEKAIVKCIMCIRANYYQYTQYDKRKLNYTSYSLDQLEEDASDGFYVPYHDDILTVDSYVSELVVESFNNGKYFFSFFLDALFNFDMLSARNGTDVDIGKFKRYLSDFTEEKKNEFANGYGLSVDEVSSALVKLNLLPEYLVHLNLNQTLNELKKDTLLKELLLGE